MRSCEQNLSYIYYLFKILTNKQKNSRVKIMLKWKNINLNRKLAILTKKYLFK